MTTLDDVQRTLDPEVCVIDDAEGPTSIAGVMGGARSEVRDSTTRVLMEAATWNGPNIQRTSTRLGLRTEASGRFEKQLQPEQGLEGQAVATKLMIELCGARPVGGTIDVGGPGPEPVTLRLRDARTERLLGAPVPRADAARILAGLGFGVAEAEDGLDVTVPPWRRGDVEREADLIEEVARLWGLDRFPATLPSRRGAVGRLAPEQRVRRRAEDALVGAGLSEAVGWSFSSPDGRAPARAAGRRRRAREPDVRGPLGHAHDAARLAAGLAAPQHVARVRRRAPVRVRRGLPPARRAGQPQARHGQPVVPGRRSRSCRSSARSSRRCMTGRVRPASWGDAEPPRADFFAAKGVLEALMRALRVDWRVEPASERAVPASAPRRVRDRRRRARRLARRAAPVGRGASGTSTASPASSSTSACWRAPRPRVPRYEDLTSFPAIRQDLAVVVADDVPAARVLDVIRSARRRAAAQRRGLRRLPRRARSARAARRSRSGSSSAPPTAR